MGLATTLVMLMQAATVGPAVPDGAAVADCAQDGTEIVVCGHHDRPDAYRLPPSQPETGEPTLLPKAEFGLLGKARMNFSAAPRSVGGVSAPAAMATIKIPF